MYVKCLHRYVDFLNKFTNNRKAYGQMLTMYLYQLKMFDLSDSKHCFIEWYFYLFDYSALKFLLSVSFICLFILFRMALMPCTSLAKRDMLVL